MSEAALYTGMVGAKQAFMQMQLISNNLANVNTTGHRAELPIFSSYMVQGEGLPTQYYSVMDKTAADFAQGPMINTDRNLDVAINGPGFIAVQTVSGSEGYTRNGSFVLSSEGFLKTDKGDYVLGQQGLITIPPSQNLTIGQDGTITVQGLGQNERSVTVVDRIKLVNPPLNSISRGTDGYFYSINGTIPADNKVKLVPGNLEGSNVNPVDQLVDMIEASRFFELQVKMMKSADENGAKATELLNL